MRRERTGRWREAQESYQRINLQFPDGRYAAHAQRRIDLRADHFAIQMGVFTNRRNADRLVTELRQQEVGAYVHEELRSGVHYFVVLVGRHDTYEEVISALGRMKGYVRKAVIWP